MHYPSLSIIRRGYWDLYHVADYHAAAAFASRCRAYIASGETGGEPDAEATEAATRHAEEQEALRDRLAEICRDVRRIGSAFGPYEFLIRV